MDSKNDRYSRKFLIFFLRQLPFDDSLVRKSGWSIKQHGHNGLNVLDHVLPPGDECALRTTAAMGWNTKKKNV